MIPIRVIRRRIRSIINTAKITKAMEMVAASKMKQSQQRVLAARPYAEKMREVVADLAAQPKGEEGIPPLLNQREIKKVSIVHITSDRGLCGGLNANVNRKTATFILEQGVPANLVTVGRKGRDFMSRYGREIRAEFTQIGDRPTLIDTTAIARVVIDDFINKNTDQVYISFTQFINTINQKPVLLKLLPIEPAKIERAANLEYIYEPSASKVLGELLPRYIEMQIYHAILESIASEQSARMVAMRNATDNALEMIDDLTLVYNKARQEIITKELLDITSGIVSLG
jgi:F-type H+-transporting ATPase subunit gamma